MSITTKEVEKLLELPRSRLSLCASRGMAGSCRFLGEGVLDGVPPRDLDEAVGTALPELEPEGNALRMNNTITSSRQSNYGSLYRYY